MAIIIKCKLCRKRLYAAAGQCPACEAEEKTFVIDYWPEGRNGKRVRKPLDGITDYQLAIELDIAIRNSIKIQNESDNVTHYSATFNDLYQEYLDWRKRHMKDSETKEKSYRVLEYVWKFILRIIGDTAIIQFNQSLYQITRKTQKVINKTINNELFEVAGFFNWRRKIKKYPIEPFVVDKLPCERPIPIILSPDEVIRLIKVADPLHKAFYLCLYTLGWRFAEAQYLKGEYVDFQNKIIKTKQKGGTWKISVLNKWLEAALLALWPIGADEYVFKSKRQKHKDRPQISYKKPISGKRWSVTESKPTSQSTLILTC